LKEPAPWMGWLFQCHL